jgi:hypothetical protein
MVHDDDTGRRNEFPISGAESRRQVGPPAEFPSDGIQEEIIELHEDGADIEYIVARIETKYELELSPEAIMYILQLDAAAEPPELGMDGLGF